MKRRILIWGTGKHSKELIEIWKKNNDLEFDIIGFVDNDIKKQGKLYEGYVTYSPLDLLKISYDAIIIGTYESARREIEEQIYSMSKKIIIKYDNFLTDRINLLFKKEQIWRENVEKYIKDYIDVGCFTYGIPEVMKFNQENARLTIGKYCSIASGVKILLGGNHMTDFITTYPFSLWIGGKVIDHYSKGDIIIGNDVWIGSDVKILSGVTIGNGAVVAANSVVTKTIEPYSICGGNPAKTIKYRFSKEDIEILEQMKWWDWNLDMIVRALPLLQDGGKDNVKAIYQFYKENINQYSETRDEK